MRHYIKRNRSRMKQHLANRQASPVGSVSTTASGDELLCRSLAPGPTPGLLAPGALQPAEHLIRTMSIYIEGAWETKQWFLDHDGVFRSRKGGTGRYSLIRLWSLLDRASQLMGREEKVDLVGLLDPAFAFLDDIVRDECPRTIPFLLSAFEVLHGRGRQDLTDLFLKYVRDLSSRILGPAHPQTRVWEHALAIYSGEHSEIFQRFFSWLVTLTRQGDYKTPCRMERGDKAAYVRRDTHMQGSREPRAAAPFPHPDDRAGLRQELPQRLATLFTG